MSSDAEFDTSKVAVKTYVPAFQKEVWAEHADRLGMSQSEFVRTMVQAGRRGFEIGAEEAGTSDDDPRSEGIEDRVLEVLEREGPLAFEDLVDALTDDVERRVEGAITELQDANRVRHSPRRGYARTESNNE